MYLDTKREWVPPEWPEKPPRRLTERQESVLMWLLGVNLLLLFVGPLAGVTLFDGIYALFAG
jgi:hypothetical protein